VRRPVQILAIALICQSCTNDNLIPLNVELGTRAVSKLPFVIAEDQGLYEKYGLDVDLRMPAPGFDGGIRTHSEGLAGQVWRRIWTKLGTSDPWRADVFVDGLTPNIVKRIDMAGFPHRIAIAATDCLIRAHIVTNEDIDTLNDLKGKRIGISARRDTTTGFAALTLAQKMGWDPDQDISIKLNGRDVQDLRDGLVDAIIASEVRYAVAKREGFKILEDTQTWNVAVAGNSAMVTREWIGDEDNHEAIRRFLRALSEALSIFHTDRELSISILQKWHGISDRQVAETIYDRGQWMPRKPYPCYQGVENTFELYDSNEMRRFSPSDFYDDEFLKALDESGFIDSLYDSAN
jgi:hypothetical protein